MKCGGNNGARRKKQLKTRARLELILFCTRRTCKLHRNQPIWSGVLRCHVMIHWSADRKPIGSALLMNGSALQLSTQMSRRFNTDSDKNARRGEDELKRWQVSTFVLSHVYPLAPDFRERRVHSVKTIYFQICLFCSCTRKYLRREKKVLHKTTVTSRGNWLLKWPKCIKSQP